MKSIAARLPSIVATLLVATAAPAQVVDSAGKKIELFKFDEAPVVDGVLDDDAWAFGTAVTDFHQVNPDEYSEPSEKSIIHVVYTKDALYVAATFYDREPDKVNAQVLRQGDFSYGEDSITVMIDPFGRGRNGYAFDLNVNGVRSEAVYANVTNENWQWKGIWHGASRRNDRGWTAEIEIPFKTLSFDPGNDTWGLNFARYIGRKSEHIGWVSANRTQNPAISGKASGIRDIEQGVGLDVVPGFRTGTAKDHVNDTSTSNIEPSVDVFYKLTTALTAALTVNTDFSGTGADERQINLTRFGLFFPERRGFFLQDTDIFEFGRIGAGDYRSQSTISRVELESGRPFFSRRIGLSNGGETVDINFGGKLTGRPGGWDVGVLGIRQDAYNNLEESDLFVARFAANVLEESSVGAIFTHGDPNSNLANSLAGVDFRYTNTRLDRGRSLEAALWYQQSDTEGLDGDSAAYGLSLGFPNAVGFRGAVGVKELQRNFYPALGFVNRNDVRDLTLEGGYTWYPQSASLRTVYTGADYQRIETLAGNLQSELLTLRPLEISNAAKDTLRIQYLVSKESLEVPFEIYDGVTIAPGLYAFDQYCVSGESADYRRLVLAISYCDGDFFGGTNQTADAELVWRPNMHFKLVGRYGIGDVELPGGSFITRLASLRADIAFTNAWYWENLLQYDNVSESIGINSIIRYFPRAGREVVIVVNREYVDMLADGKFTPANTDVTFKVSYTFRF